MTIAVVYLARAAEGFQSFERFAESYRRYPAGCDHELILLCKGFVKRGEFAALEATFAGTPYKIIPVSDNVGFDIHAYFAAAKKLSHDYLCFLNTFSTIQSDGWLQKLYAHCSTPGVGMVGATGSYESLYETFKIINKAHWIGSQPVRFDDAFARQFAFALRVSAPYWVAATQSRYRRIRRLVGDRLKRRRDISDIIDNFEEYWVRLISTGGPMQPFARFPRFPNPHVRSNAFLLQRREMLAADPPRENTKIACCEFESGETSLSRYLINKGKRLLTVDADGRGFDVADWPDSRTFRSKRAPNLLVADNQTRAFDEYSDLEKDLHIKLSWGDGGSDILGIRLDPTPLRDVLSEIKAPAVLRERRLYSIVIPTHNRADLLQEAVTTISRQRYQNWELVIFDNASEPQDAAAIAALAGNKIRCFLSSEFLHVTESWNRAIDMARGDYITLLGDDDGLTPGYFNRLSTIADRFGDPDLVFGALYQFLHPGVMPGFRLGRFQDLKYGFFFEDKGHPFVLSGAAVSKAVRGSLNLRRNFTYNIQGLTFKRAFLDKIRTNGKVFQSAFPDYYIANVALALAEKVVVDPRPMAVQGISRASFGFTLMNKQEERGYQLLNHDLATDPRYQRHAAQLLPGPLYNTNFILTMDHVSEKLGPGFPPPDFQRYRRLQIFNHLMSQPRGWRLSGEGAALWSKMTRSEKLWARRITFQRSRARRPASRAQLRFQKLEHDISQYAFTPAQVQLNEGDYLSVAEIFSDLERRSLP